MHKLTATIIRARSLAPGLHSDGGSLYLKVTPSGTKSWVFRYTFNKKTYDLGIGGLATTPVTDAREKAAELRKKLAEGINPKDAKALERSTKTWGECVMSHIDAHRAGWSLKQADIWEQSLRDYGPSFDMPAEDVSTTIVVEALRSQWTTKTSTAKRVQTRIERVWASAKVEGIVCGDNPARWTDHLDKLLAKPSKIYKPKHFPALPYKELPEFMAELMGRTDSRAKALQFIILTATRTNEVMGFDWNEDKGDVWHIPETRMKAGKEHIVPLVQATRRILDSMNRELERPFYHPQNQVLFYLQTTDKGGLGRSGLTVHGFRSAFSDWAHDTTAFPSNVIELSLAHSIKDKTEAAYRRGHMLEKRTELMQAWADYCLSTI